jgi:hypothetical protein
MPAVASPPTNLGARLVAIALADVNKLESTRNRAPWIQKYWPATDYPQGYANREPYCAAAVTYWVAQWLKDAAVLANLGMTASSADRWRCKSAGAFRWLEWARAKGVRTFSDSPGLKLLPGDIMVFDMSHIGIVESATVGSSIYTIEANTGATGGRDGDGCFRKIRPRSLARGFIRLVR